MIRHYLALLLGMLTTLGSYAQSSLTADTLQAQQWVAQANSLAEIRHYDSAVVYYQKASQIYRQHGHWRQHVRCLNATSLSYGRALKNDQAEKYARKALSENDRRLERDSPEQADAYCCLGVVRKNQGDYTDALQFYRRALAIRKKHHNEGQESFIYNAMGNLYIWKGEIDTTLMYQHKALRIQNRLKSDSLLLSDIYRNVGDVYYMQETYDSARLYYFSSLSILKQKLSQEHYSRNYSSAMGYNNLGLMYYTMADYEKALQYLHKAAAIFDEVDKPKLATSLANIAALYGEIGAPHKALSYLQQSLRLHKKYYGITHQLTAGDYHNIGCTYQAMQKHEVALTYFKKASGIESQVFSPDHPERALTSLTMGESYQALGRYQEALRCEYESVRIYELSPENHFRLFYPYQNLASIYGDLHENENTLRYYRKALAIGKKHWNGKHPDLAKCYNELADFYRSQNNIEAALENYEYAIAANSINDQGRSSASMLSYLSPISLLESLVGIAEMSEQRYYRHARPGDLQKALLSYQRCDTLILHVRRTLQYPSDRIEFGKKTLRVYEGGIRLSLTLADKDTLPSLSRKYREQAFRWADKSKGGVLALALADTQAKQVAGVPDSLLAQEHDLRVRQAYCRSQLVDAEASDAERIARFEDQLFELTDEYEALIRRLEQDYPRYYTMKYQPAERSLPEMQASLDKKTALLEYFVGDSTIYIFTLTAQNSEVRSLPNDSILQQSVATLRQVLDKTVDWSPEQTQQMFQKQAHHLYQHLVAPALASVEASVEDLIIIPDGMLSYLPFETLLTRNEADQANPQALPYLLRDYRISYAYSAASQASTERSSSRTVSPKYVAFAPSYATDDATTGKGAPLAWNQIEASQIGQYLKGTSHMGEEATEAWFKREASQYDVLHLAMHAYPDTEEPMQSRLAFSGGGDNTRDEDGTLYAHELYAMELPLQLAVLSACNTGDGTWARGEGMMSLARAFAYAGCRSLVLNRWAADDASTAQLMDNFYRYLSQGKSKAEALQRAKLDFLDQTSPAYRHPFYWAGFVVVGDPSPVVQPTLWAFVPWPEVGVIALAVGLLAVAGWLLYRRGNLTPKAVY